MISKHYRNDREQRQFIIDAYCGGDGVQFRAFTVDRGHKNGAEIHVITTTAIIIVYNAISHKMVTKLIARPSQIQRYYSKDEFPPKWLLDLAREHQRNKLNKI